MQEIRILLHYEKHSTSPEISFLGALGLDKNRDKLIKIINELKSGPKSALELSKSLKMNRSAINYYLGILMNRGIVEHYNHKFHLTGTQFTQIVQYIEMQAAKTMKELREIAKQIDEK